MKLKEMRDLLAEQMALVRDDCANIAQAESIANLAGKTLKAIQQEIQAEAMRESGKNFKVFEDILA